jgi:hypothetical protein
MTQETRYQRIAREQAERQAARAKRMAKPPRKQRKQRKRVNNDYDCYGHLSCDGEWRDNLGESPDY